MSRRRGALTSLSFIALASSVTAAQTADTAVRPVTAPIRGEMHPRDAATAYVYTRPRTLQSVTDFPAALGAATRDAFRARHIPVLAAIAIGTGAFIAADEVMLAETRRFARRVDLPPNHPSANLRIGPFKQPFPTTLGSGLYFIGDGMTSVIVAGSFAARGSLANDMRARRTASEVIEGLLAAGTVTQVLKHTAGRQTPSEATVPRGRWRPFPKLSDYNANVPAYDAFPSGHLASTMSTITVIALNYPEHKFIWPVGSVAMGVLSFAMVNNGVHWASDYPLALGIGGIIGKAVATRGRKVVKLPMTTEVAPGTLGRAPAVITPLFGPRVLGLRATW